METIIDKFGRVVIPKMIRDHLGLKAGSVLYIEENNLNIVLRMTEHGSQVQIKKGIAVYVGQAVDFQFSVQSERNDRLDKLGD